MKKVQVVQWFRDKENALQERGVGEVFETSNERADELEKLGKVVPFDGELPPVKSKRLTTKPSPKEQGKDMTTKRIKKAK